VCGCVVLIVCEALRHLPNLDDNLILRDARDVKPEVLCDRLATMEDLQALDLVVTQERQHRVTVRVCVRSQRCAEIADAVLRSEHWIIAVYGALDVLILAAVPVGLGHRVGALECQVVQRRHAGVGAGPSRVKVPSTQAELLRHRPEEGEGQPPDAPLILPHSFVDVYWRARHVHEGLRRRHHGHKLLVGAEDLVNRVNAVASVDDPWVLEALV